MILNIIKIINLLFLLVYIISNNNLECYEECPSGYFHDDENKICYSDKCPDGLFLEFSSNKNCVTFDIILIILEVKQLIKYVMINVLILLHFTIKIRMILIQINVMMENSKRKILMNVLNNHHLRIYI